MLEGEIRVPNAADCLLDPSDHLLDPADRPLDPVDRPMNPTDDAWDSGVCVASVHQAWCL